jgi:hypothetical protein
MKRKLILAALGGFLATLAMPLSVLAASPSFQLQPFEYVGTAADCGGTAGIDTVTARWDDSTGNGAPSILLQKNGSTSNCAAAGVDIISSLEGQSVTNLTELNFEYENGGHCGGGAPRFNVVVDGNVHFLGCNGGTQTDLSNGWTRVTFGSTELTNAGITTGTLDNLYIIFDEGTDTPTGGTIGTAGTVHIDNVSVNGYVVGSPSVKVTNQLKNANKDTCKKDGWEDYSVFKNQGQCVSYFARNTKSFSTQTYSLNSNVQDGINIATTADKIYKITIAGTWTNRGGEVVDAECTSWQGGDWKNEVNGGFSSDLLDVQVNQTFVDWGACNSSTHTYTLWVLGDGNLLNLRVFDGDTSTNTQFPGWFGDINGTLMVTVTE